MRWKIRWVDRLLRYGSLAGGCRGLATLSGLGLAIRDNGVVNLLKPGNSNGAAFVGLLGKLLAPA